jgi:hypothetical protein
MLGRKVLRSRLGFISASPMGGAYFYNHEHPWLNGIVDMSADTNAPKLVESSWHIGLDYGFIIVRQWRVPV